MGAGLSQMTVPCGGKPWAVGKTLQVMPATARSLFERAYLRSRERFPGPMRQVASLSHLPRIVKLEGHLPSGCVAPFLNSIFAPRPPSCLINHLSSSAGIVDYNEVLLAVLLVRVSTTAHCRVATLRGGLRAHVTAQRSLVYRLIRILHEIS